MRLYELAHSRAGDKGDTSNLSVIAYRAEDYPLLEEYVTAERVKAHFGDLVQGVQSFARSQPTAFFGLAFLAGFGAVRFLKSAAAPSRSARSDDTWRETEAGFSAGGGSGK